MKSENFEVLCPHCKEYVIIEQINCSIFRHGVFKNNLQQINPHLDEFNCNILITNNKIYGCGKPFKIILENNKFIAIECDYI